MLLPRLWMAAIVLYNVACGFLAIVDPSVLEKLFPGSAALFGTTPTMLSRALGSYALSIAGVRLIFVLRPTSVEAFWAVIWTFIVFESMFAFEVIKGLALKTVVFGVVAGVTSMLLLGFYKVNGYFEDEARKRLKFD